MSTNVVLEAYVSFRRAVALLRATEAKSLDLGHSQISILYLLSLSKATMGELAEYTSSDKSAITRTIASLEKEGLVKRRNDEKDKRITIIELTSKGQRKASVVGEIRNSIGRKLDSALSSDERKQFVQLVQKIISNLK